MTVTETKIKIRCQNCYLDDEHHHLTLVHLANMHFRVYPTSRSLLQKLLPFCANVAVLCDFSVDL